MSKTFFKRDIPVGLDTSAMVFIYNTSDTPKQVSSDGKTLGGKEHAWVSAEDAFVQKGLRFGYFKLLIDGTVTKHEVAPQKPKRGRPRK